MNKYISVGIVFLLASCATLPRVNPRVLEFENKCIVDVANKSPNADNNCTLCLELSPENAQCLNGLGAIKFNVKDFDKAMELFSHALSVDPALFTAHNNIGVIFYIRGDFASAVESFLLAIDINPQYTDARLGAALAYYGKAVRSSTLKDAKVALMESKDQLQKLLLIDPNYRNAKKLLENINAYIDNIGGQ